MKLIILCGPTATGKTATALRLAHDLNGECISADSRQVYQGMDIGTGKDLPPHSTFTAVHLQDDTYSIGYYSINSTKIWLYDLIKPNQIINAAIYRESALTALNDIKKSNKIPIFVGGTGFYLKSIIDPPDTISVQPNEILRQDLNTKTVADLQSELQQLDQDRFNRFNTSDRQNPRRLIRAIEVAKAGQVTRKVIPRYDVCWIGLTAPKDVLADRIRQRVIDRVDQGFDDELKKIRARYPHFSSIPAGQTIGYREWMKYIQSECSVTQAIEMWTQAEVRYMKRQLTWFGKNPSIAWFDITDISCYARLKDYINHWLNHD